MLHRSLFASRFVVGTYRSLSVYFYKPLLFLFFFIIYLFQVMSVKAIGIALKLTLSGTNQLVYPQTWAFTLIVLLCVISQMNYLNKVTTAIFFRFNHLILEGKLNWLFIVIECRPLTPSIRPSSPLYTMLCLQLLRSWRV